MAHRLLAGYPLKRGGEGECSHDELPARNLAFSRADALLGRRSRRVPKRWFCILLLLRTPQRARREVLELLLR